jgi:hypothetical protein
MKFVLLIAALFGPSLGAQTSYSVCDVARLGRDLDRKTITVRGVWRPAAPESRIFDELADSQCHRIEVLVVTYNRSLPSPPPPGFKLDSGSVRRALRIAEKTFANKREVSATIVGFLYAQEEQANSGYRTLPNGVIVPPHHQWYPLILLIQSIRDVK